MRKINREKFLKLVSNSPNKREIYLRLWEEIPKHKTIKELSHVMGLSYPVMERYLEPFKMFGILSTSNNRKSGYVINESFFNDGSNCEKINTNIEGIEKWKMFH